ncbi:hypothetical protein H6F95_17285 [Cyanobacteria bacterium FACHB-471]|nr:hypothetical protein [Cyanobacteria bacterium FACHB-471]
MVVSSEGKTACCECDTDGWGGYERVLGAEVDHYIGKTLTQRAHEWNPAAIDRTLASTAEQVWQTVATDGG